MAGQLGSGRAGHAQMLADAISNRLGNVLILGVQVHRVGFLLSGQRLKPALLSIQQLFRCLRGIAFAFAHPLPAQGFRRLAMQQREGDPLVFRHVGKLSPLLLFQAGRIDNDGQP